MRVKVIGDCDAAAELRGYLRKDGHVAVVQDGDPTPPNYTVRLKQEVMPGSELSVDFDSVDCPLERDIFRHVRELTSITVTFHTAGGIQSDQDILISFSPEASHAVALGAFRGFVDFAGPAPAVAPAAALSPVVTAAGASPDQLSAVYERALQEKDAAHGRLVEELKAGHADRIGGLSGERALLLSQIEEHKAALASAHDQIDSLNQHLMEARESARPGAADALVQRLEDQKNAYERTIGEIKLQTGQQIAERDNRIARLEADLKAAEASIHPAAVQKAMSEALLAEKEKQVTELKNRLSALLCSRWARFFLRG